MAAPADDPVCANPARTLALSLSTAREAFAKAEQNAFTDAVDRATASIDCLDELISPAQAAELHRMMGLREWIVAPDDDKHLAQAHFAAARALDPEGSFAGYLPDGHLVHGDYVKVDPAFSVYERVPPDLAEGHRVQFDGVEDGRRPMDWPATFQHLEGGRVVESRILEVGEPLPALPLATPPVNRSRRVLLLSAGGAAALSGTAFIAAAVSRSGYNTQLTELEGAPFDGELPGRLTRLDSQRGAAGGWTAVGVGSAALSAGLGGAALLVRW